MPRPAPDLPAGGTALRARALRGWRPSGVGDQPRLDTVLAEVLGGDPDGLRRFDGWIRTGALAQDRRPACYVYRLRTGGHELLALTLVTSLHAPDEGVVLPHEAVSEAGVQRQCALVRALRGQVEPVVTVRRGGTPLLPLLRPHLDRAADHVVADRSGEHAVWTVDAPVQVAPLLAAVSGSRLLLADGHHRYAAWRRLGHRTGLTTVVDEGAHGLVLGAIHRVLPAVDPQRLDATGGVRMRLLSADAPPASVHRDRRSTEPADRCRMTDGRRTWELVPSDAVAPGLHGGLPDLDLDALAVSRLHRAWLPQWGVEESEVTYVHRAEDAVDAARHRHGLAVLLPRPTLGTVERIAREGSVMPAKATSFRPKPPPGLVLRHWGDGDLGDDL